MHLDIKFLGYVGGAVLGLFTSSVNPNVASVEKQQTAREVFREMKTTTHGYAKNFAVIGCIFSAIECTIESVKLKQTNQMLGIQFLCNNMLY